MATLLVLLLAVVGLVCAGLLLDPGTYDFELTTPDQRVREYTLHVPLLYNSTAAVPLVFDNHGFNSNAVQQAFFTGYRDVADAHTFAVVHPSGVGDSWNAATCCGQAQEERIDDVLFFRMMVDDVAAKISIDRARVFSTGMSNGAFMSHRLGMEADDVFNAIGPVAGTVPYFVLPPRRPVGVYHIHGLDDPLVPYEGNLWAIGVEESMLYWEENNGCTSERQVTDNPDADTVCETWTECPDRALTLCLHPGRHVIPEWTAAKTWEFFAKQAPLNLTNTPLTTATSSQE